MSENVKKVLMGALMAAVGAALTYGLDALPQLDIPPVLLPVVTAGLSIVVNALRKYAPGILVNVPKPEPAPVPAPVDIFPHLDRPILDLILQVVHDRLKAKDSDGVQQALALYRKVADGEAAA